MCRYATDLANAAASSVTATTTSNVVESTLLVSAFATHRNVRQFKPLVRDPEIMVKAWNHFYPDSVIKLGGSADTSSSDTAPGKEETSKEKEEAGRDKEVGKDFTEPDTKETPAPQTSTGPPSQIYLTTEAFLGSSFVGMVHFLKADKNKTPSERASQLRNNMRALQDGLVLSGTVGGTSLANRLSDRLADMWTQSGVRIKIDLVCLGYVPSIKPNVLNMAVREFKSFDPDAFSETTSGPVDATVEPVITEVVDDVKGQIEKQSNMGSVIKSTLMSLEEATRTFTALDMQSFLIALDDYVKNAPTMQGAGVPIGLNVRGFSREEIVEEYEEWKKKNEVPDTDDGGSSASKEAKDDTPAKSSQPPPPSRGANNTTPQPHPSPQQGDEPKQPPSTPGRMPDLKDIPPFVRGPSTTDYSQSPAEYRGPAEERTQPPTPSSPSSSVPKPSPPSPFDPSRSSPSPYQSPSSHPASPVSPSLPAGGPTPSPSTPSQPSQPSTTTTPPTTPGRPSSNPPPPPSSPSPSGPASPSADTDTPSGPGGRMPDPEDLKPFVREPSTIDYSKSPAEYRGPEVQGPEQIPRRTPPTPSSSPSPRQPIPSEPNGQSSQPRSPQPLQPTPPRPNSSNSPPSSPTESSSPEPKLQQPEKTIGGRLPDVKDLKPFKRVSTVNYSESPAEWVDPNAPSPPSNEKSPKTPNTKGN
eukprot:TRINITY_DN6258_c0_g2_i2.p1 TRINITY_DN6258_c0_g2~~TRINITY_DN6258_c0_g2_i2.p1  ORF type:complete len:696 (+),score=168.77 TRINITY_DN6258_c0_g2_i2:717-2804(+)